MQGAGKTNGDLPLVFLFFFIKSLQIKCTYMPHSNLNIIDFFNSIINQLII